jgi:hypothetical protein
MPRQSHPQMGDFKSPAIMLSAWLIVLLLGKVWASHSVAGDSGLLFSVWFSKDREVHSKQHRVHIPQDIFSCTPVARDSWCQFEHVTSNNKIHHISLQFSYDWIFATSFSIVGIIIMLWAGRSGVRIPAGATELFYFSIMSTRVIAFYSIGTGDICEGFSGQGMMTTHIHLVSRLRMNWSTLFSPFMPSCPWMG